MYFNNNVENTNIDKELKKKKKSKYGKKSSDNKSKFIDKKKILIFSLVMLFVLVVIIFIVSQRNKVKYYIDLIGTEEVTVYQNEIFIDPGYKGHDNKGNDLTDKVVVNNTIDTLQEGEYQITYTLYGKTVRRMVKVIKRTVGSTLLYLKGSTTIVLKVGDTYEEPGYKVIDSVDGNLGDKVIVSGNVNTSEAGTYKITYTVTNNGGVTTSKERIVIVK